MAEAKVEVPVRTMTNIKENELFHAMKLLHSTQDGKGVTWWQMEQWVTRYGLPMTISALATVQPWVEARNPSAGAITAYALAVLTALQGGKPLPPVPA